MSTTVTASDNPVASTPCTLRSFFTANDCSNMKNAFSVAQISYQILTTGNFVGSKGKFKAGL